jgi:predicted enzyme related to lactoylglutathione lyase
MPEQRPAELQPGEFCWDELVTPDPERALAYYKEIMGWRVESQPMGPIGTYHLLHVGDQQVGGIMKTPPGAPPKAQWFPYILVDDVDGAARRVSSLGGKVMKAADDIPNIGRFAVAIDPTGAVFALFKNLPQRA